ncbi:MAG TPA: HDOD domain-containing protein [Kofleriaceae bacterium]|jgi:putative nucleotidyltransferase with HDIG domain
MTSVIAITDDAAKIVSALDALPTLPVIALQIGEVVHSKTASVQRVADLLRADPATSAKLLRLVNSPYFGIPGGVADIARAIPFVGFNTLYELVLSISVIETLGARALWSHSLTVATAARELATELKAGDPGTCFTAGLLHDMGSIALAKLDPAAREAALPIHDRIGSELAKRWRFPAQLAAAIEHHHTVGRPEGRRIAPQLRSIAEVVAAADHISRECAATFGESVAGEDGDPELPDLFARNGVSAATRQLLADRTRRELERSKVFLSLLD